MKVLKFGGTSVGSAQRIKNVASIICDQEQKIVVLSAMAGTTNSLVEISECFHKKDPGKANAILSALEQAYVNHIEELYQSDTYKERVYIRIRFTFPSQMRQANHQVTMFLPGAGAGEHRHFLE